MYDLENASVKMTVSLSSLWLALQVVVSSGTIRSCNIVVLTPYHEHFRLLQTFQASSGKLEILSRATQADWGCIHWEGRNGTQTHRDIPRREALQMPVIVSHEKIVCLCILIQQRKRTTPQNMTSRYSKSGFIGWRYSR